MAGHERNFIIKVTNSGTSCVPNLFERKNGQEIPISSTTPIRFDKSGGKKKTDFHKLKFTIQNGPGCDLVFLQDKTNVMWAHEDINDCPDSFCEMPDTFWTDKVEQNLLHLINMDLKPGSLRFTINLVDRSVSTPTPADYVPLDPIVTNGNGGNAESFASAFLATILTGGLVGLGTAFAIGGADLAPSAVAMYGIGGAIVGLVIALFAARN